MGTTSFIYHGERVRWDNDADITNINGRRVRLEMHSANISNETAAQAFIIAHPPQAGNPEGSYAIYKLTSRDVSRKDYTFSVSPGDVFWIIPVIYFRTKDFKFGTKTVFNRRTGRFSTQKQLFQKKEFAGFTNPNVNKLGDLPRDPTWSTPEEERAQITDQLGTDLIKRITRDEFEITAILPDLASWRVMPGTPNILRVFAAYERAGQELNLATQQVQLVRNDNLHNWRGDIRFVGMSKYQFDLLVLSATYQNKRNVRTKYMMSRTYIVYPNGTISKLGESISPAPHDRPFSYIASYNAWKTLAIAGRRVAPAPRAPATPATPSGRPTTRDDTGDVITLDSRRTRLDMSEIKWTNELSIKNMPNGVIAITGPAFVGRPSLKIERLLITKSINGVEVRNTTKAYNATIRLAPAISISLLAQNGGQLSFRRYIKIGNGSTVIGAPTYHAWAAPIPDPPDAPPVVEPPVSEPVDEETEDETVGTGTIGWDDALTISKITEIRIGVKAKPLENYTLIRSEHVEAWRTDKDGTKTSIIGDYTSKYNLAHAVEIEIGAQQQRVIMLRRRVVLKTGVEIVGTLQSWNLATGEQHVVRNEPDGGASITVDPTGPLGVFDHVSIELIDIDDDIPDGY